MQQRRHEERAFPAVGIDDVEIVRTAEDDLGLGGQVFDPSSYLVALPLARQRAHVDILDARVADADLAEAGCKCADDITGDRTGCDDPPYRRALLSRLRDHLVRDFLDVEIKLLGSRYGVGPEYRHVERVGLRSECDRLTDDPRVLLQHLGRGLRACKRDRVLAVQVVEQVTDATTNELHATVRQ